MRPPILKTLEVSENLRRYKDEVGGLVVARSYVPELEARVVDDEPAVVASLMRDRLLSEWNNYRDCIDYFELLNEVAQTGEDLKRLTEFTVECCRLLHDEGHMVAVGSFSVGNPPDMVRDWQTFKPAVYAADAVALHEYGAPYVWSQPGYHNPETLDHNWWCLRYRRVRELMARTYRPASLPPFIITECGIDRGLFNEGRKGWKSSKISPAEYVKQLAWYNGELVKDDYVLGATVFGYGMNDDWADFELAGVAEFADYIGGGVWPASPPAPAEPAPVASGQADPVAGRPAYTAVEDWHRVGEYARWSLARIENKEDPRHLEDFKTHLGNLGAEAQQPRLYGWPD